MISPFVPRILQKIDQLLGAQLEEKPEAKPSGDAARQQALIDAMAAMRTQLQRMGAGFGAGATLVLAGLGYAQLHEVFPLPEGNEWLTGLVALLGVTLALVGAVMFAGGFFKAQRRILISTNRCDPDITGEDAKIRKDTYRSVALEENAPSIQALELRARRFERLARATTDDGLRKELESEAARLTGAYRWAMYWSAGRILERRSRDAFGDSRRCALVTALGIVLAFGAADYSKGQRDRIALFKACQEAIKAGADEACNSVRVSDTKLESDIKAREAKTEEANKRAALVRARQTFRETKRSPLERVEACSKVLSAAQEQAGTSDASSAAVVKACVTLIAG